jgi:hypothetical protein
VQKEATIDNTKEKYAILLDTLIESIFQGISASETYQKMLGSLVIQSSTRTQAKMLKII